MGEHRAGTARAHLAERTRARLVDTACRRVALDVACSHAARDRLAETIGAAALDRAAAGPWDVVVDGAVLESVVSEPWVVALTVAERPVALAHADWVTLDDEFAWTTIGSCVVRMQGCGLVRVRADDPGAAFDRAVPVVRAMLAGLRPTASL